MIVEIQVHCCQNHHQYHRWRTRRRCLCLRKSKTLPFFPCASLLNNQLTSDTCKRQPFTWACPDQSLFILPSGHRRRPRWPMHKDLGDQFATKLTKGQRQWSKMDNRICKLDQGQEWWHWPGVLVPWPISVGTHETLDKLDWGSRTSYATALILLLAGKGPK